MLAAEGHHVRQLDERPELHDDLHLYYRDYKILSASRQLGFGEGPIPMSEIYAYIKIKRINGDIERSLFLERIMMLDAAYMKHLASKMEK